VGRWGFEVAVDSVGKRDKDGYGVAERNNGVVHWCPLAHRTRIWEFVQEESEGRKGVYVLLEFRQEQVFSSRRSKIRGDHLCYSHKIAVGRSLICSYCHANERGGLECGEQ